METQLPNIEKEISRIAESVKRLEEGGGRFIDLSRVPLICQSIVDIREDLKEIKGLGLAKAGQILACLEIARRLRKFLGKVMKTPKGDKKGTTK